MAQHKLSVTYIAPRLRLLILYACLAFSNANTVYVGPLHAPAVTPFRDLPSQILESWVCANGKGTGRAICLLRKPTANVVLRSPISQHENMHEMVSVSVVR